MQSSSLEPSKLQRLFCTLCFQLPLARRSIRKSCAACSSCRLLVTRQLPAVHKPGHRSRRWRSHSRICNETNSKKSRACIDALVAGAYPGPQRPSSLVTVGRRSKTVLMPDMPEPANRCQARRLRPANHARQSAPRDHWQQQALPRRRCASRESDGAAVAGRAAPPETGPRPRRSTMRAGHRGRDRRLPSRLHCRRGPGRWPPGWAVPSPAPLLLLLLLPRMRRRPGLPTCRDEILSSCETPRAKRQLRSPSTPAWQTG